MLCTTVFNLSLFPLFCSVFCYLYHIPPSFLPLGLSSVYTMSLQPFFWPNGHTRFCGLFRGPQVDKQLVVYLRFCITVIFMELMHNFAYMAAGRKIHPGDPRVVDPWIKPFLSYRVCQFNRRAIRTEEVAILCSLFSELESSSSSSSSSSCMN